MSVEAQATSAQAGTHAGFANGKKTWEPGDKPSEQARTNDNLNSLCIHRLRYPCSPNAIPTSQIYLRLKLNNT